MTTPDSPAVVVAGVNGTAASRAALAWAAEEAVQRGCALHAVTAWSLPTPSTGGRSGPPSFLPDVGTYARLAAELVEDEVRAVVGDDVDVRCLAVRSRPVEALLSAGRDATLLVVGARRSGGLKGLRPTSVNGQVTHRAPCPVLVVPARGAGA